MFAIRGIAVSFSVFFILYGVLSLAVWLIWRKVVLYAQRLPSASCADLLFTLRIAPFGAGVGATLALILPSFLLLEPRSVNEPMGFAPVALGICGAAVLLVGIFNAMSALFRASITVARWSTEASTVGSSAIDAGNSIAVLRTSAAAPPLTVAGIVRPQVWLSSAAEFVLTERELQSALRHEVVHVLRRDNLKKLVLCLVAFPGMTQLECAWREAAEMTADDAAVSNTSEALDLAAAVIKLSRLVPLHPPAELATSLVHSPAESVNARVERLVAWTEKPSRAPVQYSWRHALSGVALAIALIMTYSQLLVSVHAMTEWLVR